MNKVISPEIAKEKMRSIEKDGDTESAHVDADALLCNILRGLGYGDAVDIFESIDKWYA